MTLFSLKQRTLIGLATLSLGLGSTLEIASAATTVSTRNLEELTTTELTSTQESLDAAIAGDDAERVAIKFKKHHGRKFKKHRGHTFGKHHGRRFKKHRVRKFKKHDGHIIKKVY